MTAQTNVGAVEPQRGCDGITAPYLPDRGACIAASLGLDSSHSWSQLISVDLSWSQLISVDQERVFVSRDALRHH